MLANYFAAARRQARRASDWRVPQVIAYIALAVLVPDLRGATITWDAGSGFDFNWNTGANWDGGAVPTLGDDVVLPGPIPGSPPGNNVLLLSTGGASARARSLEINGGYTLGTGELAVSTGDVTVGSGVVASIDASLIGAGGLHKLGGGTLNLTSTSGNTFGGAVNLEQGVLGFSAPSQLGDASATNTINIDGGTLQWTGSALGSLGTRKLSIGASGAIIDASGSGSLVFTGGTSAVGTLKKTGLGTLRFSGTNVQLADVEVLAGKLTLNTSLTTGTVTVGPAGLLDIATASTSVERLSGTGLVSSSIANNTVTATIGYFHSDSTFYGQFADSTTAANAKLVLCKRGNGTFTLASPIPYSNTGGVMADGGILAVNLPAMTDASNGMFSSACPLKLGVGTLQITGKPGTATTQAFAGTTLAGGNGKIVLVSNGAPLLRVDLGALTQTAAGGAALFTAPAGTEIRTTTARSSNGIYSGRMLFTTGGDSPSYDWATTTSSASPYVLSPYSSYTTIAPGVISGGSNTNNGSLAGSASLAGSFTTNSLRIATSAAGQSLNLGANSLTLTSGGLLFAGSDSYTISGSGALVGGNNGSGSYDLLVHQYGTGTLTISSLINSGASHTGLVKNGPGKLVLTGINNFTNAVWINEGEVSISNTRNLGTGTGFDTGIYFGGGTLHATATLAISRTCYLYGAGATFDVDAGKTLNANGVVYGSGPLKKIGSGTLVLTTADSWGGPATVQEGVLSLGTSTGNASTLGRSGDPACGTVVKPGATLDVSGHDTGLETITIAGAGAPGQLGALADSTTSTDNDLAVSHLILAGDSTVGRNAKRLGLSNGVCQGNGFALTKEGTGTLALRNLTIDNLGDVWVNHGALALERGTALGGGSAGRQIHVAPGAGFQVNFGGSTDRPVNLLGDNCTVQVSDADAIAANPFNLSGDMLLQVDRCTAVFSGTIAQDSTPRQLTKRGNGTAVLAGTAGFTNGLVINGGVLKLNRASTTLDPLMPVTLDGPNSGLSVDNIGAKTALTQPLGCLSLGGTEQTIQSIRSSAQDMTLAFADVTRSAGGIVNFVFTGGTAGASNRVVVAKAPPGQLFNRGAFVDGSDFAWVSTEGAVRAVNYGVDPNTAAVGSGVNNLVANAFTKLTGAVTAQQDATVPSLNLSGGSSLSMAPGQTLTLGSTLGLVTGGLLKSGGGTASISGGTVTLGDPGEVVIRTDKLSDALNVTSDVGTPSGNTITSLTKSGRGTLILSGNNQFAGVLRIHNGQVLAQTSAALGLAGPSDNTAVSGGATLGLAGGITTSEPISLSGTGMSINGVGQGALRNAGGENTVTGMVTAASPASVVAASGKLTIQQLNGNVPLTIVAGAGATAELGGSVQSGGYTGNTDNSMVCEGAGTVIYSSGATFSNIVWGIAQRNAATVIDLGNRLSAGRATDVLYSNTELKLSGTNLLIKGAAGSGNISGQTLEYVSLKPGYSTIAVDPNGGAGTTLEMDSISRSSMGSANILPGGTIKTMTTGVGANYIIGGWMTYNGDTWAVGSTGAGLVTVTGLPDTSYQALPASGGSSTVDYRLSGSQTIAANCTVGTLKVAPASAGQRLTINSGQKLSVYQGGLLFAGQNPFTIDGAGTIDSTYPLYIHVNSDGDLTIGATLSASTWGRTGNGAGRLILTGSSTVAPTLVSGETRVDPTGQISDGRALRVGGDGGQATLRVTGGSINLTSGPTTNQGILQVAQYASTGIVIQDSGNVSVDSVHLNRTADAPSPSALARYDMHAGLLSAQFSIQVGATGPAEFNQDGGTVHATAAKAGAGLVVSGGANSASRYNMTGGTLEVLGGCTIIGQSADSYGTFDISQAAGSSAATFQSGLILGRDLASAGTVNQTGGVVSVGSGTNQNISGASPASGAIPAHYQNVDLVIGMNLTVGGDALDAVYRPARASYNLSGGELRANGITAGAGADAVLNWSGGTIRPVDRDLAISAVPVVLSGAQAILSSSGADGQSRNVIVDSVISESAPASSLTVTGNGAVVLTADNTYSGATVVNGGTLRVTGSIGRSSVSVGRGASFEASPTGGTSATPAVQHVPALNLASGPGAGDAATARITSSVAGGSLLIADSLTLTGDRALIDITTNGVVINYDSPADRTARNEQVRAWLIAARNSAGGGKWDGVGGITSSSIGSAWADYAVGYIDSSLLGTGGGKFMGSGSGGVTVDDTAVLVRHTLLGDANLDGVVNFTDLLAAARGYDGNAKAEWATGDFNYDGSMSVADLLALAKHYDGPLPPADAVPGASPAFRADWQTAIANVPEPAHLAWIGLLLAGAVCRRRRGGRNNW